MKISTIKSICIATLGLFAAHFASAQSIDYYLHIPSIKGSSVATGYEEWITVSSYGLSVSNDSRLIPGTGVITGNAQPSGLELLIQADSKAIPYLFEMCNAGTHEDSMIFAAVSSTDQGVTYEPIKITLEIKCVVASLSQEGASGDLPVYSLLVLAEKITIATQTLDPSTGTPDAATAVEKGWDYGANKSL